MPGTRGSASTRRRAAGMSAGAPPITASCSSTTISSCWGSSMPSQFSNGLDRFLERREGLLGARGRQPRRRGDPCRLGRGGRRRRTRSRPWAGCWRARPARSSCAFATSCCRATDTAGLGLFACEHLTPAPMRRPAWLAHPNGAKAIRSCTIVAAETAPLADGDGAAVRLGRDHAHRQCGGGTYRPRRDPDRPAGGRRADPPAARPARPLAEPVLGGADAGGGRPRADGGLPAAAGRAVRTVSRRATCWCRRPRRTAWRWSWCAAGDRPGTGDRYRAEVHHRSRNSATRGGRGHGTTRSSRSPLAGALLMLVLAWRRRRLARLFPDTLKAPLGASAHRAARPRGAHRRAVAGRSGRVTHGRGAAACTSRHRSGPGRRDRGGRPPADRRGPLRPISGDARSASTELRVEAPRVSPSSGTRRAAPAGPAAAAPGRKAPSGDARSGRLAITDGRSNSSTRRAKSSLAANGRHRSRHASPRRDCGGRQRQGAGRPAAVRAPVG